MEGWKIKKLDFNVIFKDVNREKSPVSGQN